MNFHTPHIQTVIFIWLFFAFYFLFLLRQAIKNLMHIYDFLLLSAVAFIPAIFVTFPKMTFMLSEFLGVEFPFVLLFAALIFVLFIIVFQLIRRINKLKKDIVDLTQAMALQKKEKE